MCNMCGNFVASLLLDTSLVVVIYMGVCVLKCLYSCIIYTYMDVYVNKNPYVLCAMVVCQIKVERPIFYIGTCKSLPSVLGDYDCITGCYLRETWQGLKKLERVIPSISTCQMQSARSRLRKRRATTHPELTGLGHQCRAKGMLRAFCQKRRSLGMNSRLSHWKLSIQPNVPPLK